MAYKKSEETRLAIVNAARKLFAAQGYEQTDMKSIAAEVGLTHAALYYYFSKKEDVAWEIYRVETDGIMQEVEETRAKGVSSLFLCIYQYVLFAHKLAFNPVTESYFFDAINYRGYDHKEMMRVRDSYYPAMEAMFADYGRKMTEDEFAVFILTSDAYAKAILCAIRNKVVSISWKEALDQFFRQMILTEIQVPFEEYAKVRDEVFAYMQF